MGMGVCRRQTLSSDKTCRGVDRNSTNREEKTTRVVKDVNVAAAGVVTPSRQLTRTFRAATSPEQVVIAGTRVLVREAAVRACEALLWTEEWEVESGA